MKAFIRETAAKATAETLGRREIPFQKLQHQESQRTSPRHLAVPHSMKMWEPLVRPLTPERRLVVSTDALRSPLGTAAPSAPESVFDWRGGSPLQAYALRPVTDCNCIRP